MRLARVSVCLSILSFLWAFLPACESALAQQRSEKPAETSAENRAAKEPPVRDKEEKEEVSKGMRYRLVGPYRGGRSLTASGVPGDPNTYYFGSTGGGVWKSTDGALSWKPVFNHEGSSSIGGIAVSPSDPNAVYV